MEVIVRPSGAGSDPVALLEHLRRLRRRVAVEAVATLEGWGPSVADGPAADSAANLAAYLALRHQDLRGLQRSLVDLGLSSLGRAEGHVLATLDAIAAVLAHVVGQEAPLGGVAAAVDAAEAARTGNEVALFGRPVRGHHPRIMVTLPAEAADDPDLVDALVSAGMDCARINCAHDHPERWERMAANVRDAAWRAGRACTVLMDLSGPRLRTGALAPGPPVVRLRPRRDGRGRVVAPAEVVLDAGADLSTAGTRDAAGHRGPATLAVDRRWLDGVEAGGTIHLVDLPGRHRRLGVERRLDADRVLCTVSAGCYLGPGTELRAAPRPGGRPPAVPVCRVGAVAATEPDVRLHVGDALLLLPGDEPGGPADDGPDGRARPARIGIGVPGVIDDLRPGHRVVIDGGVLEAVVRRVDGEGAHLQVTWARPKGTRLRSDKGVNLPDTQLQLDPLTTDDLAALDHVVRLADAVGYSFVRDGADVARLCDELAARGGERLAILAKVETAQAVANLPEIIVAGAARHPLGVMIARGDLAVEIGWRRMAEVQEELLWVCQAAHVPVVWATQVLESLVRTGVPTRAEITDAALAERADCVMLNKGPHQVEGVEVLHDVLRRMAPHRHRKTDLLPPLVLDG